MLSLPSFIRPRKSSPIVTPPVESATERAIAEFIAGCGDAQAWQLDAIADAVALARFHRVEHVGQVARFYHNAVFAAFVD